MSFISMRFSAKNAKQECIPVRCVPTAAVATTRRHYPGGWADPPPHRGQND